MSLSPRPSAVEAIVLDIEGTTTPVSFVYDVLFPFARAHLREHLEAHADQGDTARAVSWLRDEWLHEPAAGGGRPGWDSGPAGAVPYVEWLMARDRKSPGLKLLQGEIWRRGYESGALRGEVFPDVPPAFTRWHDERVAIAIYSSGSVLAQKLLFASTRFGDLTRYVSAYFDTAIGPKTSAASYASIADRMGTPPGRMLFVSDAPAELEAAHAAGLRVLWCVRPGCRTLEAPALPRVVAARIETFDEIG